ncbi:MAG TPA: PEP-CTERM system TPR-repeat protein PrsT [Burkholderiaceae bacterium]|nr:PEP-CTERM system TPR-repeat protein PrsT [Burkholderiaceae bacterium]
MKVITLGARIAWRSVAATAVLLFVFGLTGCRNSSPEQLLQSARAYQAKGDHRAAIIELKNVIQQQPENGEARILLGESALVLGDPAGAEKEFRRALEYKQPAAVVAPLLARALLDQDKPNKVIEEFGSTRLDTPGAEAELRARVGDAYLRTREFEKARASFDAALAADPGSVRALLGHVRLLALEGDTTQAATLLAKVVEANPKSAEALTLQSAFRMLSGDHDGALASLEAAVAANPTFVNARFELISLLVAERKWEAAAAQVDATRALLGSDPRLTFLDAQIAAGRKDYTKARELAQQVLKRAPEHVPSLVLLAGIELEQKQYASAETLSQQALRLVPAHPGARSILVRSYLATNQPARALEAIQPFLDARAVIDPSTQLLIAETYLANGQLQPAAQYYGAASGAPQQQSLARIRLGQIALAQGDLAGGIRILEEVAATEGTPVQADLALIAGYTRSGDSAKALQTAQALTKKQPNSALAYQVLGAVHGSRREYAAARAAFDRALAIDPVYLPAAASLAKLDLADGKPAEARGRFEAVVAKDPKNEQALLALAEIMVRMRAPVSEVEAVLKRAVAAKPESPSARVALIGIYLQGNRSREALAAAQEASAALGQDPRVMDALGRAQLAAGDTNQAIETFNRLSAAQPKSPAPLVRLASAYVAGKEFDRAIGALQRAQKLAPNDATIARDLVATNLLAGKNEAAVKEARAYQQANPKFVVGYILEGDAYVTGRQWAPAEHAYREALKADPAATAAAIKLHGVIGASGRKSEADGFGRKWLAEHPSDNVFRGYLAEQALRLGDLKSAVALYSAIIAQQPDNAVALNNLAWAAGQLGDPKALGYAERALKLAPDSPQILDTIGVLLVAKGDTAAGLERLSRAVALAPDRHDVRLNYAKALLKAGRTEEGRKELQQLQAVTQDFPGKAEVAALLKQ